MKIKCSKWKRGRELCVSRIYGERLFLVDLLFLFTLSSRSFQCLPERSNSVLPHIIRSLLFSECRRKIKNLVIYYCSQLWPNRTAYLGLDDDGQKVFPTVSSAVGHFLARTRRVYGFGMDTATPEIIPTGTTHRSFSEENVYIVENLANLQDIPYTGAHAIVTPMKIGASGAAAARVFALVPRRAN